MSSVRSRNSVIAAALKVGIPDPFPKKLTPLEHNARNPKGTSWAGHSSLSPPTIAAFLKKQRGVCRFLHEDRSTGFHSSSTEKWRVDLTSMIPLDRETRRHPAALKLHQHILSSSAHGQPRPLSKSDLSPFIDCVGHPYAIYEHLTQRHSAGTAYSAISTSRSMRIVAIAATTLMTPASQSTASVKRPLAGRLRPDTYRRNALISPRFNELWN